MENLQIKLSKRSYDTINEFANNSGISVKDFCELSLEQAALSLEELENENQCS